jgi:hypothetical protein
VNLFPVLDISHWAIYAEEQVGSKEKVWLQDETRRRWLLKYPRPGTGEHWTEAMAAAVAELLGIPHAEVELAVRDGEPCSISLDFRRPEIAECELVLGNALLSTWLVGYDRAARKEPQHTVEAVLELLGGDVVPPHCESAPPGVSTAPAFFVGYLLLDALIGNTDRHHENWGLVVYRWQDQVAGSQAFHSGANVLQSFAASAWWLAPSFDHASSLGGGITDRERKHRLVAQGEHGTVEHFCNRGKSPFYLPSPEARQLRVREVFERALSLMPEAGDGWLHRLHATDPSELIAIADRVPTSVATDSAREFAKAVLQSNLRYLLKLFRT